MTPERARELARETLGLFQPESVVDAVAKTILKVVEEEREAGYHDGYGAGVSQA